MENWIIYFMEQFGYLGVFTMYRKYFPSHPL